jgi:hypothetical protein
MRRVYAFPLFALAFAMGFNVSGAVLTVKSRLQALAVSTTTITSAPVEK